MVAGKQFGLGIAGLEVDEHVFRGFDYGIICLYVE